MVTPHVSVCIPAYNAAKWIRRAIDSVLAQSRTDFELVVVDDASEDDTVEVVRGYTDPRITLFVNPRNIGEARSSNQAILLARAELVKFLHADDRLEPDCLARLVPLIDRDDRVGFAFSCRTVALDDEHDSAALTWRTDNAVLHLGLEPHEGINRGRPLFERYLAAGFQANWVGEPTCALVRKECLRQVGGFSLWIKQAIDIDLWVRLMAHYDVAFVEEELCVYRFGGSVTTETIASGHDRLDRLWMLRGLNSLPRLAQRYPDLSGLYDQEFRLIVGQLRADAASGRLSVARLREVQQYVLWQVREALGRAPPLWGEIR